MRVSIQRVSIVVKPENLLYSLSGGLAEDERRGKAGKAAIAVRGRWRRWACTLLDVSLGEGGDDRVCPPPISLVRGEGCTPLGVPAWLPLAVAQL